MTQLFSLNTLLKKHRLTLVNVVFLSVLESLLFVAQFYFIGKAVNDLLKDSWSGIYVLIALFVGKSVVSYIKQRSIGKTYKTIYDRLIMETFGHPIAVEEQMDSLAPKSAIIYEIAGFFKGDLIKGFETIVRLLLVLIMLFIMNKVIFGIALILAIIVFFLYFIRKRKTIQLSVSLTDEWVKEHQILQEKDTEKLLNHHKKLEELDEQLLGISAINLSIIEVLSFFFMIAAIVMLVKTDSENALGTFFTMLYYVMAFSETMFLLPSVYQTYLKIQEVSKKI